MDYDFYLIYLKDNNLYFAERLNTYDNALFNIRFTDIPNRKICF